ncbi:MAG: alcohol dehydrogenase [Betaproteobacteria bacterium]|nr:alcohol dehydrogenase [Betaproteobacteria bacterium]
MKAIQITRTGGPEVLDFIDIATPTPGPGQVLIKAHSIGVCMPEIMVRKGMYHWMPPLPAIPGIEMSGTVVAMGDQVTTLKVGQPVWVSAREFRDRGGCYAEYIAADADRIYALPPDVDMEQAAGLANYQVAWHLLHSATQGFQYEWILVPAAAGGVGSALIQLANAAGKRVIGLISSKEKASFCIEQGALAAINYRTGNISEEIKAATDGHGIDLILDPVGGPNMGKLFDYLAPFGTLILYGGIEGPADPNVLEPIRRPPARNLAFRTFTMHVFDNWPARRASATQDLLRLFAAGVIKPPIHDRIPLAEARRAHEMFESGRVLGKLIMKP